MDLFDTLHDQIGSVHLPFQPRMDRIAERAFKPVALVFSVCPHVTMTDSIALRLIITRSPPRCPQLQTAHAASTWFSWIAAAASMTLSGTAATVCHRASNLTN